ncbi:hypothetical protein G3R49_09195 [Shewanella sp. WXL01]|uniref:hypothetical protein n=1 Tax=Shewanella sp. WXL01 TaxID=2709721 RepID=UPI0014383802|nr:hypothetical protein [Shewanella sp. WXL01]NKF50744.1 hypothetical protein [Shewanella sp. WXL01]
MKKLVVGAGIVSLAALGYVATMQDSASSNSQVLANVPADTVMLSAQLTPFPIKQYLASSAKQYQAMPHEPIPLDVAPELPISPLFISLFNSAMAKLDDPQAVLAQFGIADTMRSSSYFIGALPVMKFEVTNPAAFWAEIDRAEVESGVLHQAQNLRGLAVRSYPVLDSGEPESIDLVIAEKDGWVTFTFKSSLIDEEYTAQALDLAQVSNPITQTSYVEDIFKQYNFTKDGVSFINHQALMNGLTSESGNTLAKQISGIAALQGSQELAMMRSTECHTELMSIANNWPKTVMGIDKLEVKSGHSTMASRVIVESKNAKILKALSKLQGFVPSFGEQSLFAMGLGIDVGEVSSSINAIWSDLQTPSYQCAPLAQMQQEIAQQNPMMLGMMTGMADGVKGISISVNGYQLSEQNGQPKVDNLDALVAVSAQDPSLLLNMVAPFYPPLAQVQLTDGGEAVDVSSMLMLPPEYGVTAKLALRGNHLVLFSGEKGVAMVDNLASQKLENNGFIATQIDYKKAIGPLIDVIENSGEEMPPELEMFKHYDMNMSMDIRFTDNGIELGSKVEYGDK